MLMLVLVIAHDVLATVPLGPWRAFSSSFSSSGAAVNVNISGSEICSPFFTLTSTSSGPCQTLMLTPVVSVPLVSSFDGSSCPANTITLSMIKPTPLTTRIKLSSPIRAVDGSIEDRTGARRTSMLRLIAQNGVRFSYIHWIYSASVMSSGSVFCGTTVPATHSFGGVS